MTAYILKTSSQHKNPNKIPVKNPEVIQDIASCCKGITNHSTIVKSTFAFETYVTEAEKTERESKNPVSHLASFKDTSKKNEWKQVRSMK